MNYIPPAHMRILPHVDLSEQGLRELEIWLRQRPGTSDTVTPVFWAVVGFSGSTAVPSRGLGAPVTVGFQPGLLITNAPDVFSLRLQDGGADPDYYGLDVARAGYYTLQFTAQVEDTVAHPIATPEVELVIADNSGGHTLNEIGLFGSNAEYGYQPLTRAHWDISWWKPYELGDDPGSYPPIAIDIGQNSGETLIAYTNIFVSSLADGGAYV